MYEFMLGYVVEVALDDKSVSVDVNGIGFVLNVSEPFANEIRERDLSEKQKLWTHFVVRETDQQLYAFSSKEEREVFRVVLGVSGVGPKTALSVSGVIRNSEQAREAVAQNALRNIKGVGPKSTAPILKAFASAFTDRVMPKAKGKKVVDIITGARDTLLAMGYSAGEVNPHLERLASEAKTVQGLISSVVKCL